MNFSKVKGDLFTYEFFHSTTDKKYPSNSNFSSWDIRRVGLYYFLNSPPVIYVWLLQSQKLFLKLMHLKCAPELVFESRCVLWKIVDQSGEKKISVSAFQFPKFFFTDRNSHISYENWYFSDVSDVTGIQLFHWLFFITKRCFPSHQSYKANTN